MKLSKGFWQTYKETPAEAQIPSHRLMLRTGLIHKSAAGIYDYLPMGYRSIRKIEQIVREEMDRAGAYELLMSVVTPGELWQESGRWDKMGDEMLTFKDKGGRDLCISPTNEEAVTNIFRKTIKSYKQLPLNLYQINTKFRDEIRPRFGLMRGREFTMKDAYSFDVDKKGMDASYEAMYQAYCAIFDRCGLDYSAVEADAGNIGSADSKTHEFQVIAETGEDEIVYCEETSYAANRERATTLRPKLSFDEANNAVKEVPTPGMATIEDVCRFLKKPQHHSIKSLVYSGVKGNDEEIVLIQLLGDDELNEIKLKNFLGVDHVTPASDNILEKYGLPKGYIGAVGLKTPMRIIFDQAINRDASYVAGALKVDTHFEGFIPSRDVQDFQVADLRLAQQGDFTEVGKGAVAIKRGIEVGHIFQLGDLYAKALGVTVLDQNGKSLAPLMGCYGIGVTRIIAAAIEQNHDEKGIIWPKSIAPYDLYLALIGKSEDIKAEGEELYQLLKTEGYEVVYDDRNSGAGFKFKDAELLGLPLTVVLGEKTFKASGELEIVERKSGKKSLVKKEELIKKIKELYQAAF